MPMRRGPRLDPSPRRGEHFVMSRVDFAHSKSLPDCCSLYILIDYKELPNSTCG
jgi:hypothetical protein